MAAFDFLGSGNTLEDALTQQAGNARQNIEEQYAKKRRQLINQQAGGGRLRSGVSNYQFGDLAANQAGDLGQVESALSGALNQVPLSDFASQQDDARKRQLAEILAQITRPSALEEALGAFGQAGNLAATGAAFF